MKRSRTPAAAICAVVCALVLSGCPNPQSYTTPRTTPPGKVAHTIAVRSTYLAGRVREVWDNGDPGSVEKVRKAVPIGNPTYHLRIGVFERVDVGVDLSEVLPLGASLKVNPLRGPFDIAVAPGAQIVPSFGDYSDGAFFGYLPLMLGANLTHDASVVLTPGATYTRVKPRAENGSAGVMYADGYSAMLGLGLNYRFTPSFALHPEITVMRGVTGELEERRATVALFGLGINAGALPDYSDLEP